MATLHAQYREFDREIMLNDARIKSLKTSRRDLRRKIRNWFRDNKEKELQPKFGGQGSFEMNTMINPIPVYDAAGKKLLKYDLDYGIYFIEKEDENNRQPIETWRDWVCEAVDGHTDTPPERHKACIRVIFADGHHVDLPIYYKKDDTIELAHRDNGWIISDPKAFYDWFNKKKEADDTLQREHNVRYLKAWKNFQECEVEGLCLPNGVCLTILATNHHVSDANADVSFRKTVDAIHAELTREGGFQCLRPTTPEGEDLFKDYSYSMRTDFLDKLRELQEACKKAADESNQRTATEFLREKFGTRFPLGADIDEEKKSQSMAAALSSASITPRPFSSYERRY